MTQNRAILCCLLVTFCLTATLVPAQEKCGSGRPESHDIAPKKVYFGVGCTQDEARAQVLSQLMEPAEKERKLKCPECTCNEGETCTTFMWGEDWKRIDPTLHVVPITLPKDWQEKCHSSVGWKASIDTGDKPGQFKTSCTCIPKTPK